MDSAELSQLRASFQADLRDFVNFFDAGGVDHEHGSFCCGLSHKGERISGTKFIWFNGRGAWVYSRLHNTGVLKEEKAPRAGQSMSDYLLGVAKGAVNFILSHGRDASGGWVVETDAKGNVLKPAEGSFIPTTGYGSAFIAEGLAEYALASGDTSTLELALDILRAFVKMMDDPERPGDLGPWPASYPGLRVLGHHMICLNLARGLWEAVTEMRRRGVTSSALDGERGAAVLAELVVLLDRMIEAILGPFVHPEFGLCVETLDYTYGRPDDGNADLCYLGHAIETMWMLMAEAERRGDESLYARAATLFRRHVECAWDPLCGGLFRGVWMREWRYLIDGDAKVKWEHDEVIVGCLMLIAHPPKLIEGLDGSVAPGKTASPSAEYDGGEDYAVWAARSLRRVLAYNERAFSLRSLCPGSWKVGGDRLAKPDPDANGVSGYNMGCKSLPNRVEHYHLPRMLMNAIRLCDQAIANAGTCAGTS